MENNSSWHSFEDILQSFNSLSRISKHKPHHLKNTDKLCTNSVEGVSFPNPPKADKPSSFFKDETLPKCNGEFMVYGMGRGKMIQNLEDKFGTEKLDKQIHSELRQLNPCGFSNGAIEESFGFENKNHCPSYLGKGGLHCESDKMSHFEDNVIHFSGFSEEIQSFSSPIKENESYAYYKNNVHKTEVHEDHNKTEKNGVLCEENIIPTSDAATNESISKQVKKRRCRNFVVLKFSSRENNDRVLDPILKEPNELLKQSQMQLKTSNEFNLLPSDFPPI